MCFDKTGTLTEEGLDMYGARPVCYETYKKVKFAPLCETPAKLGDDIMVKTL